MTKAGEQPTITQADIELWRAGNAAALDAAGYVMDAEQCRQGQFDNLPTAKAFQQEIASARTTSLAAQDGLVEALEWYADRMCEGWCDKDPKSCEAIGSDNCSGCRAHVALSAIKGDKS